jgi:hypothetical protein
VQELQVRHARAQQHQLPWLIAMRFGR